MSGMKSETGDDDAVVVECDLDAPPAKVWRALTVPALAADWLGALPLFKADQGESGGEPRFEVIEARPCVHLTLLWRETSAGRRSDSIVTIELSPGAEGGTRFRLVHAPPAAARRHANANMPRALAA